LARIRSTGDVFDQTGKSPVPVADAQPQPGAVSTLARENVAAARTIIKEYAEMVARGGWAACAIDCAQA
jgi:hypothetical protein